MHQAERKNSPYPFNPSKYKERFSFLFFCCHFVHDRKLQCNTERQLTPSRWRTEEPDWQKNEALTALIFWVVRNNATKLRSFCIYSPFPLAFPPSPDCWPQLWNICGDGTLQFPAWCPEPHAKGAVLSTEARCLLLFESWICSSEI